MTLTAVGRVLLGPGAVPWIGAGMAISTLALNDADNSAAAVHRAPKAGVIDRGIINLSAKTGTSTTVLLNIALVTVDANGNPTSTPYGGSAIETRSIAALATGQNIITLATPATVTSGMVSSGDVLFAVRIWPEGTVAPDVTNNVTIRTRYQSSNIQMPYEIEWATAWTKNATYPMLTAQYNTAGGDQYIGLPPVSTSPPATVAFGSGSTPNEIGALFQVPFACTCIGAGWFPRQTTPAATGRLGLYDNTGTLQRSGTYPAGAFGTAGSYGVAEIEWAGYDLLPATNYRLGHLATSIDTRQHLEFSGLASAAQRAVLPHASLWQRSSRTNSADTGAWAEVATTLPPFYLIISQIDFSLVSGGGGGGGAKGIIF